MPLPDWHFDCVSPCSMTRVSILAVVLLWAGSLARADDRVISTFAGGAPPKTPVPAVQASVGVPNAVAVGPDDRIYFAGDHCVYRTDRAGVLTRIAGNSRAGYSGDGGPATKAQLNNPLGVAVDRAGNVFIADADNFRIRKVAVDGTISTVAGTGVSGYTGDGGPAVQAKIGEVVAMSVDGAGNLYLDDFFNAIRKVSAAGIITTLVTTNGPVINGHPDLPMGIAADFAGNLYVADTYKLQVRRIATNGSIEIVAGNGAFGSSGDGGPARDAQLNSPDAVAVDAAGNLYIGSGLHFQVRKVAVDGTISTIYAGDAQQGTSGASVGVAADSAGTVYMTDYIRRGIRRFGLDGNWSIVAGDGDFSFSGMAGPQPMRSFFCPPRRLSTCGGTFTSRTPRTGEFARCRRPV
jgi:sugar lactone lactonase YvrE